MRHQLTLDLMSAPQFENRFYFQKGFTLIEVLVATALLAVLLVIVFSATQSALRSFERLTQGTGRQTQLASALSIMNDDFYNLLPRPIRTGQNTQEEAFRMSGPETLYFVEFTRGGLPIYQMPLEQLKSMNMASPQTGMARVAYHFTEESIYRYEKGILDTDLLFDEAYRSLLLDKVTDVQILSYSRDKDGTLQEEVTWPPVKLKKEIAIKELPQAISLTIYLEDLGPIDLFYAGSFKL